MGFFYIGRFTSDAYDINVSQGKGICWLIYLTICSLFGASAGVLGCVHWPADIINTVP